MQSDPNLERTTTSISPIIRWMNSFLRAREAEQVSRNTLKFYRVEFKRFLSYCTSSGIQEVEDLSPDFMRGYFIHLSDTGRNTGGVDASWRALKAFTRWYEYENEPPSWRTPFLKMKRGRIDERPLPPIEFSAVRRLIEACKGQSFTAIRDRALFLFLLDTGLRAFEVCALNLEDVDAIEGLAIVQRGKGGKHRAAAFGRKTARSLRAYIRTRQPEEEALWQTDEGTRLTYSGMRQILRRRALSAGISKPSLHSFRRACSLALTRAGVSTLLNQKALGHSDPKTTLRYNALISDDLIKAYSKASPVDNSSL